MHAAVVLGAEAAYTRWTKSHCGTGTVLRVPEVMALVRYMPLISMVYATYPSQITIRSVSVLG